MKFDSNSFTESEVGLFTSMFVKCNSIGRLKFHPMKKYLTHRTSNMSASMKINKFYQINAKPVKQGELIDLISIYVFEMMSGHIVHGWSQYEVVTI